MDERQRIMDFKPRPIQVEPEIDFDLTQVDRLLAYFQGGGKVTSMDAYEKFKITQLGRCIADLERRGHHFNRPWKKLQSGKVVREYSLIKAPKFLDLPARERKD